MDQEMMKVVERIEKLMRLAGSNPNEAEAASALTKAQELLAAYNLDMSVIEQASGASTKRLDEQFSGGMHKYQRQLWRHIAELNFCFYWTQKNRAEEGSYAAKRKRKFTHQHRIVGRQVNVVSSKNMAIYLEKTIERLCRDWMGAERSMQYYSRDAVAYREGVADRVIEKILDRRNEIDLAEKRKEAEAARKASEAGTSFETALTIAGLSDREKAANYDFLHGEGAWAKKEARAAEFEKDWDKRQAARAEATVRAEKEYAEWAAAHPEEAEKEAKKERARERAKERYREKNGYRSYRFRETASDMRKSSGSYHRGYKAGEKVSIDPQMGDKTQRRIK